MATKTQLQGLTLRPPTIDEAQQVLDLMIRCELSEYGQPDVDMEDLLHDWEQIDLSRNAWLAFSVAETLLGYAAVLPWGSDLRYDFYVDPAWNDTGLGQMLLDRCEARGPAYAQERQRGADQIAKAYVAHINRWDKAVVKQAGFQLVKYHYNMQIDLTEPFSESDWPETVTIRPMRPEQDEGAIFELIEAAFARPDRTPLTFEEWKTLMIRSDIFEANLWFLAEVEGELVGACLGYEYPSGGWVRQLGVAPKRQGQGIGSALLRHAFAAFKKRGCASVGLGVEADNENACALYQRLGMKRIRQYDEYVKPITC